MKSKTQETPSNYTLVLLCGEERRLVRRVEIAIKERSPWVNVYYELTLSPNTVFCESDSMVLVFQYSREEATVLNEGFLIKLTLLLQCTL